MHKSLGIESSIVITALHFANLAPKLKYSISLSLKPSKPSVIFSLELTAKSYFLKAKIVEIPSIWIEIKNRKSNFKVFRWLPYYIYWLLYSVIRNIAFRIKFFFK